MDEFECLNLCITTPAPDSLSRSHAGQNGASGPNGPPEIHVNGEAGNDDLLPVMVWIHGGGNATGSGVEWIWDAGVLVRKSIELGKPIVVVALKYVPSSHLAQWTIR